MGKRRAHLLNISISDTLILVFVLIVLIVFFSTVNKQFYNYTNIKALLTNMVLTGILAIGLTPLMITRGLDISFGANLTFSTIVMALIFNSGQTLLLSIFIGIIISTVIGLLNGILIETFDLPPIILTLGTMGIFQALAIALSNNRTIAMLTDELYYFLTATFLKIPLPMILLIIIALVWSFILEFTKFGKTLYIIGANPTAAFLSGISVKKIRIILYTLMGFFVGISSIVMIAMSGVAMPYYGINRVLPALSAILLGGISLQGGGGTIIGTILGLLIITILFNGLSVLNVQTYFIQMFQGLALIIVVAINTIRKRTVY